MSKKTLTFGFVWDRHNPNFHENAEYQNLFFRGQENYINDRLKAGKFITVNDVADMLGFERSPRGMVYGWDSDESITFIIRRDQFLGTVTLELFASNIYEQMTKPEHEHRHNFIMQRGTPGTATETVLICTAPTCHETKAINRDLAEAIELLNAGLSLRIHGDISHQPMSQKEWDSKTEAFLRSLNEEN